ncbi:MAG: hypothetical protein IJ731_09520 [Eubacterium sp.]|nr:hypothetical protein [Eubacterium sp.]
MRNQTKDELIRLETINNDLETIALLDSFKNKFNICESVYKVVLSEHQRQKGHNNAYLKLDMRQVPYALEFAGYSFDKDLLNELFGAKSNKGTTAKKLRDAVTHGFNQDAIIEIQEQHEEIFNYMNCFLECIRTFDEAA